jgi:hypothetical protein
MHEYTSLGAVILNGCPSSPDQRGNRRIWSMGFPLGKIPADFFTFLSNHGGLMPSGQSKKINLTVYNENF